MIAWPGRKKERKSAGAFLGKSSNEDCFYGVPARPDEFLGGGRHRRSGGADRQSRESPPGLAHGDRPRRWPQRLSKPIRRDGSRRQYNFLPRLLLPPPLKCGRRDSRKSAESPDRPRAQAPKSP